MSFWQGFAQAYRDADEQKFKTKLIEDERAWEAQQLADQRKYDEETWQRRFAAEQASAMESLFVERALAGGLTGGVGTRRSGSGGGSGEGMSFEAFVKANPLIDSERLAELAPYEDKLYEINEAIQNGLKEATENGRIIPPEALNGYIADIIPADPTETITSESIMEKAKLYGINISQGTADQLSATLNMQTPQAPEVVFNPQVFAGADPAIEKNLRDQIGGELLGSLMQQREEARASQNIPEVERLNQLISVSENGNLRPVLNTPEGTGLVMEYLKNYDVDIQRVFPGFMPTFSNEDQIAAALSAGLISSGSRIKYLQPDGTYKEVVVRQ